MPDPQLLDAYSRILRKGFESATSDTEPISDELDAAALASLLGSADKLANQIEHSVIDAPWVHSDLLGIIEDWISNTNPEGEVDLTDLRKSIEPIYGTSRSLTIARTETAQAFNGGAAAGLRAHGWTHVIWIAAPDACPECAELDGESIPIGEYEANTTLHPNAVLSGSTFAPYGKLLRMVGAAYRGPAVTLTTSYGDLLTIGPNHPVLTALGFVRARDLQKGDQLIHDSREYRAISRARKLDFEHGVMVEDVFQSLRSLRGDARVIASRNDFHGDAVFHEEIKVVRTDGVLLSILEAGGIEQLRKCALVGADTEAAHVACCGTCRQTFGRIFVSASRVVGGSDVVEPAVLSKFAPRHFSLHTIEDISLSDFKGEAFDASTASGLYRSGGFVVSNCSCTAEPDTSEADTGDEEAAEA